MVIDLEEFFDGLFPPGCPRQLVAMLRACLDGSKTFPEQSPVPALTVAGFVGELRRWKLFERRWLASRQRVGLDRFHMVDFEAVPPRPPYDKLTPAEHNGLLRNLVQSITKTAMLGVEVTITKQAWDAISDETKDRFGGNPYLLCAAHCIGLVAWRLEQEGIPDRVQYLYECGNTGAAEFQAGAGRLFSTSLKYRDTFRVVSITAEHQQQRPSLDSADFFAWELTRDLPKALGVIDGPRRRTLQTVLTTLPVERLCLGKIRLDDFADSLTPEYLSAIAEEFGVKQRWPHPKRRYRW
jgi:hypothetical protein